MCENMGEVKKFKQEKERRVILFKTGVTRGAHAFASLPGLRVKLRCVVGNFTLDRVKMLEPETLGWFCTVIANVLFLLQWDGESNLSGLSKHTGTVFCGTLSCGNAFCSLITDYWLSDIGGLYYTDIQSLTGGGVFCLPSCCGPCCSWASPSDRGVWVLPDTCCYYMQFAL